MRKKKKVINSYVYTYTTTNFLLIGKIENHIFIHFSVEEFFY